MGFFTGDVKTGSVPASVDMAAIMRQVYVWLAAGLAVCFGVALILGQQLASSIGAAAAVRGARAASAGILGNPVFLIGSLVVYFILAFTLQPIIRRSSPTVGGIAYLIFTAVFGVMMSYTLGSYLYAGRASQIWVAFAATGAMFGAMSIYGYTTKADLSRLGAILFMALIGLIIATVINIFANSTALDYIISYAGVAIFAGFTAYDTQWIRNEAATAAYSGDSTWQSKIAIIGAFHLFVDFVNLFLFILRVLGGGRRG